ncbi:homoprotocatechuate degradation operon regulator HpaR [Marinobacterium sediminicola]|uniref:Homoprotocatechuate degradation operon regulator, HpaR n=1 Tax=Marinobacterium sediminicola TaxID=518898 RepID=A0ABY1S2L0_9GAMM|nr:homoprotocatechuate degradation operon regulator HpaR [Marinobacterium sediminicola]ULG68458.1 homoprotocatechuate degradation operon regulator HpaR [Marinobacterium sediminicola]SMR76790.1 homoprotocatechuate degradation operon regulator, HpaR [Marinobacterium sediminicola]
MQPSQRQLTGNISLMRKYEDSIPLKLLKAREVTMGFFRPILQEIPLTEQQWRIIRALDEHGELESKQLAELCCILSPSLTGIISRLEQQDYIQRRRSPEDQRRVLISLTDKAKEMFDKVRPTLEARYQEITDQFSRENMEQLDKLLNMLCQIKP